jgi:8-oxo-dGTP pyrophosphatase MutT (NUDIX family)
MTPAPACPASTVVVMRGADPLGIEVLLVRRHDRVAFMAGAYVFPGGRVEDADHVPAAQAAHGHAVSRFPDLTLDQERRHRLAAVRELAEEAGIRVAVGDLEPFAHWITPASEPRRYDTRFYLCRAPAGQDARHDGRETTGHGWFRPEEATDRACRGELSLPPPTWTTLKQLAPFRSVEGVVWWARRTTIARIEPRLVRDGGLTMLTLPGDPLHPAVDGWVVPEETRFVLREGRWWPERA